MLFRLVPFLALSGLEWIGLSQEWIGFGLERIGLSLEWIGFGLEWIGLSLEWIDFGLAWIGLEPSGPPGGPRGPPLTGVFQWFYVCSGK